MCGDALAERTFCCSRFQQKGSGNRLMALRQHIEGIEDSGSSQAALVEMVEAALRFGQRRDLILGSAFANPAWDIALRLYSAALKGRTEPFEILTAGMERPSVTQRWLDALVRDGLVAIAVENNVRVVGLTTNGRASMDALFASAQAGTAVS
jgi:hypothetical protein